MTTYATTTRPKGASSAADWLIPAGLIALALIPILAGSVRLTTLATHPVVTPQNIRFVASPIPVVVHIISATIYSLLGALQFSPGLRRRYPAWHRAAGRVLVAAGLGAAFAGLWMAEFYAIVPADSALLHAFRLFFGLAMVVSIILGLTAIQRRNISQHQDWMRRAYAIGLGAGTQALIQIPSTIIWGKSDPNTLALLMGGAWVINLVIAEWLIRRRRWDRSR
ncbi:DUF2306 domain-containing protein [Devosia sp.]|uniref:DUF2306 domain-containing protein n=1 Tax=Devosia sp. TaxID=1871048 RepID=UPI003267334B